MNATASRSVRKDPPRKFPARAPAGIAKQVDVRRPEREARIAAAMGRPAAALNRDVIARKRGRHPDADPPGTAAAIRAHVLDAEHQPVSRSPLGRGQETYGEDPFLTRGWRSRSSPACKATTRVT